MPAFCDAISSSTRGHIPFLQPIPGAVGAFSFRLHNEPYASHSVAFLPHSLFLTQSHSPLHHTIYANSITNTLYHSHTFNGPHSSENGEVTSNAILNRGKSIDRFSLLFFTLFLHTHTISISPFTILYFIPSSLSFYSHLRHSAD